MSSTCVNARVVCLHVLIRASVCVCICVSVKEREREREYVFEQVMWIQLSVSDIFAQMRQLRALNL